MNILVTGSSGTIGGYVLRELLRAGHIVSSYSRSPSLVEGVEFVDGDITRLEQLREACPGRHAIIHVAAVPGGGRATPEQLMSVNVIGTVHVLEAAVSAGVSKVVFASSGAATGFSFQRREIVRQYFPIDEQHPCEPHEEYGLSKVLGELTCKRYFDAWGIRTIPLRINHNWYIDRGGAEIVARSGWAREFTVNRLWTERYRKVIEDTEGTDWPVQGPPSSKNILWAVTDARDAAQAFRLAVQSDDILHEVFLINGDDTCSTIETNELIARHYPNVACRGPLECHASLVSHEKATRMLGYQLRYTWRESNFRDWLTDGGEYLIKPRPAVVRAN